MPRRCSPSSPAAPRRSPGPATSRPSISTTRRPEERAAGPPALRVVPGQLGLTGRPTCDQAHQPPAGPIKNRGSGSRLSRSLVDFAALMARSENEAWALVAPHFGVDTSPPEGAFVAQVLAAASDWERRPPCALQAKQREGARLGRDPKIDRTVPARMVALRHAGVTLQRLADELNADPVPTTRGCAARRVFSVRRVGRRRVGQRRGRRKVGRPAKQLDNLMPSRPGGAHPDGAGFKQRPRGPSTRPTYFKRPIADWCARRCEDSGGHGA